QVLLLESGNGSYDDEIQRLGETVGGDPRHAPMSRATRRQIGGTSNLWSGRCVPFDPVDFQPRELVGDARWPLGYGELERYFARACRWFECGQPTFDVREIPGLAERGLIPGWPGGDVLDTALERWSLPTNFGRLYRRSLESSPLLTLVSDLTCTEIVCRADGHSVEHLRARTLAGNEVRVCAQRYVLAAGGVESTRLLLASTRHHPAGIGNHSGHLGRWYMSHVGASIARVRFNGPPRDTICGFERDPQGAYVRRRFTFSRAYLIEHQLPNVAMWLENPDMRDPAHASGALSLIYLILASPLGPHVISEGVRRSKLDTGPRPSIRSHLHNVLRELPATARFAFAFAYRRFLAPGPKEPGFVVPDPRNVYPLYYHAEHLPHRESAITLTDERDALGLPRVRTELRFGERDIEEAIRVHEHFDRYLRRAGLGRLEHRFEDPRAALREQLFDGYHQAGTTRMSHRPEDGVLDEHLAVHGFEDLFVASSSAFVTSGQANSTFMIVVLALRLADHLNRVILGR
ncbi:MAG TPA: GMC oxidoreductase, partial [Solirubrobacteraceae bacterium]|nr:GMC oxidoreductase [Solirubrobacteraceae bacterium]